MGVQRTVPRKALNDKLEVNYSCGRNLSEEKVKVYNSEIVIGQIGRLIRWRRLKDSKTGHGRSLQEV